MSVANVKAKAPKKTSAKKVTDAEQAAVKAALEATPVEYAPLSVFVMSLLNARTIPYSTESIESMAATIKSVGLLQNLVAHELPDGELAVAAGGKRLTALNLLLSQQFLTPDYPVPFKRVSPEMAALVSYIENAQRSDMHAAEQIASFGALAYQGKAPEQIGAELGYSTRHVQRMLKLANLAPSLLKLLADDQLTVEQCQTLCLEDDQARQVRVYEEVKTSWPNLPVTMLRKLITDKEISITDKRFLFVGRETYEAAGGVVREDLFSQQEGEGTADSVLLETLTVQKLTAMALDIQKSEGWKWSMGQLSSLYPHRDALMYQLTDEPEPVYIGDEESRIDDLYKVADECAQSADDDGYSAASDSSDSAVVSTRIVNMQLTKVPKQFALWQAADNLQNMRFPDLGIPCPFLLSWTICVEEQVSSQNEAFRKEQDMGKKANSSYGKLFPNTQRTYEEWRDLRMGLASNEIAMCSFNLNLTLFTPDSDSEQQRCELSAINVFRKNDLEMSAPRYQQLRNWLTSMPFLMQEGLWDDMKHMNATLRCKSFNAVNLMPVVAERQMAASGSPLPTYRNALAFFDMFSESNGATNFNIAVTGTTGAGKSFFIQEILRQVLNAGGFGWVIDMGGSYKNFCRQAGGAYRDAGHYYHAD